VFRAEILNIGDGFDTGPEDRLLEAVVVEEECILRKLPSFPNPGGVEACRMTAERSGEGSRISTRRMSWTLLCGS